MRTKTNTLSTEEQIAQLISYGALFVSNHSGGKDSMALLETLIASGVPKAQIIVVHASLGAMEWEGAQEKARKFERDPSVVSWPTAAQRQCTSDLKRDPIAKLTRHYADAHGFTRIVNCLGIRADESSARGKRLQFSVNTRETNSKRSVWEWLPIHKLEVSEVWALIEKSGVKRHHAYDLGNERLSCVFCIMGSTGDCQNGAKHNPALLSQYIALEKKTGYTMHVSRKSLVEIVFGTAQIDALAA